MLFNSIAFLFFFPIVCILFYCIPQAHIKIRNLLLLVASYYFYMNWEPAYALLLLTSTVITYLSSLGISHYKGAKPRIFFLVGSIILNISILFMFKYYNFCASNIQIVLQAIGMKLDFPTFQYLLPVGISFYIFQALGYSIDVYRGTTKVERNFFTYALFVSFFPQLVAGPIERSNNLLPQFKQRHVVDYSGIMAGMKMMLWGYFMKLVLADRCGIYVDMVYNHVGHHNGGTYLLASILFPFQIYGDFAGYSLIAIGVARILGFQLMENFHRPYFSITVGEFWHRWHISLSTWFKDYLYIPLGGNRVGKFRTYFNLSITFLVSGIWHGANWTFICWGALHGLLLCIEKALGINKKKYNGLQKFLHRGITFILVCTAWSIFRANNLEDIIQIFTTVVTNLEVPDLQFGILAAAFLAITILTIKESANEFKWKWYAHVSESNLFTHLYFIVMISYIILFGVFQGNQFIYFQF